MPPVQRRYRHWRQAVQLQHSGYPVCSVKSEAGGVRFTAGTLNEESSDSGPSKCCGACPRRIARAFKVVASLLNKCSQRGTDIVHGNFLLRDFERRYTAFAIARFDNPQYFLGIPEIRLRDANALGKSENLCIENCGISGDDEPQRFAVVLTCFRAIVCRLCLATVLAPEIEFVTESGKALPPRRIAYFLIILVRPATRIHRGQQRRTRHPCLRASLLDAVQSGLKVKILRERYIHHTIKIFIREFLPEGRLFLLGMVGWCWILRSSPLGYPFAGR